MLAIECLNVLDQIWEQLQHELGFNFKEIANDATPTHEDEEGTTYMQFLVNNISAALSLLK